MAKKRQKTVADGLFVKNPVLISGLIAAPVIVCTDTLANARLLCFAFSLITFCAVLLSVLVPRRWVYGARLIAYTLIAAIVYVPVAMLENYLFSDTGASLGIFFPLLAVNSMIAAQTEFLFDRRKVKRMVLSLLFYVLGFDLAVLLIAVLRELLAFGTFHGMLTGLTRTNPWLATPAGGFLVVGLLSVLARKLRIALRARRQQTGKAALQ